MKPLYRNLFLAVGVVAVIVMLCTSDISYAEMWDNVRRAGYWFPAVILHSREAARIPYLFPSPPLRPSARFSRGRF